MSTQALPAEEVIAGSLHSFLPDAALASPRRSGDRTPMGPVLQSSGLEVCEPPSGGCDARALTAIGVWDNEAEAKAALDVRIDPTHTKFLTRDRDCPLKKAGVDGEQWAFETVSSAVKEAGWHMIKAQKIEGKNELTDIDLCELMKKGGSYLLDGSLNNSYVRGTKKHVLPGFNPDDSRHSTAVVEGKVHDHPVWILGGIMPMSCLWLNGSIPNHKKGFMRKLHRAYRVAKCTQTDDCEWCAVVGRGKRKRSEEEQACARV